MTAGHASHHVRSAAARTDGAHAGEYDFVVVGAGSAGSTVAARLAETDASVLLLEAGRGSDYPETIDNPSLWYTLLGSEIDWGYTSVPQPGLDGRVTYEPRGKALGGSSNLYIMMHIRGPKWDYDNWAYNGCPGWSFDDCLPYLQRLEDQEDDTNPTAGKGGPTRVASARLHDPNPTSAAFLEACAELGYPSTDDFNLETTEGAGWHHVNIKDGLRHGTRRAYLEAVADRDNLTISTNSEATRLVFRGHRVTGVEYVKDGRKHVAHARNEVIVSCGAIESPKLLLLSGVGPEEQLKQFGIRVHSKLPGVGENFHNHVLTGVIQECSPPVPQGKQNLSEAALFCKSDPGWPVPDLQIGFVHVPFNIIIGQGHPNSVSILPGVVRPLSRGWVRLASADPLAKPLVNPNYLGARSDLERLAQAVEIAREIFGTKAFSSWVKQELMPGPDVKTREDVLEFCRQNADSYHHQAGSCRMGLDELAVVDPQLRVFGVEGLRVADASVMPAVQSGNCNTGIIMVGERCADFVKQANGLAPAAELAAAGGRSS